MTVAFGQRPPPGLLVVQLDGLSVAALDVAVRRAPMPTLGAMLERRSHRLVPWWAGIPAQTTSSQAGILYGDIGDIPAFRWYDKRRRRLIVSNHPFDAAEIDRRAADGGEPLLAGGTSVGNLLTGGAARSALTMGTIAGEVRGELWERLRDPHFIAVEAVEMLREIGREIAGATRQRLRRIRPRMKRGGSFPIQRAIANVLARDLTTRIVREELERGTPVIYATYVGYDVVAHHAGPTSADALRVLRDLDRELKRLIRAARRSPLEYDVVVLSDHGQAAGSTFRQRYGETLERFVSRVIEDPVTAAVGTTESWGTVNELLSEALRSDRRGARRAQRLLRPRIRDGYVQLGPDRTRRRREPSEIVIAASGNLAHLYLADVPGRVTLDTIREHQPGLVEALARHPGIEWLVGRSDGGAPIVLAERGFRDLRTGEVRGEDPVAGHDVPVERIVAALLDVDAMDGCGDLVLNGRIDREGGAVAAFEELVGSHGGLGGDQGHAFVVVPARWDVAAELDGPVAVHDLLMAHRPPVDATEGATSEPPAAA
ncbi:MAG: alkaline phosphatase family protein [Chloroflexota bacterium]